jgi:hypothetical protein
VHNMNINFGMSECLILAGAALGCSGLIVPMWTCLGLGVFGSFIRYSLEHAEKQAQKKILSENVDNIKGFAEEFATILGGVGAGSGKNRKH